MATLTGEQLIALVTLIMTTLGGGIGVAFKRWADAKVVSQTADLKAEADKGKVAADTSKALADAWERLVVSAEKRETAANERNDRTLASVGTLTTTMSELSGTLKLLGGATTDMIDNQKVILDELRKCSVAVDGVSRELARR